MHRIEIHSEAAEEIVRASQYYEERIEGLGDQFLDEIEEAISQITEFPRAWSAYQGV